MPPTETLSRSDFDARREDGELSIALVGMSGVGKSHTSGLLAAEAGFRRVNVDSLIGTKLGTVLRSMGYTDGGIEDVANWMGKPHEPQSLENQEKYLNLETVMMRRIIGRLALPPLRGNVVIDTTGSIVHTPKEIGIQLAHHHSTVVYLEATTEDQDKMFDVYMEEPKPVVWGDVYSQAAGETQYEALARSYRELLTRRSKLYKDMAHVTISRVDLHAMTSTDEFLDRIRDELPKSYAYSASYKQS